MKKKLIRIFTIILIGFLLGVINSHLIYSGFWSHFNKGLNSVPFYVHIFYIILAFFMCILIHELGHLVAFVRRGIKIKAIYVLGFALVKLDRGWRLRFVPKFFLMLGGIVIPDHISIKDSDEEDKFVDMIQKVLIAGPNTSLVYGVIIFALWLLFLIFNLYFLNGLLFTFMVVTSIMTLLVVKSSKVSYKGMFGDYVAHKKIKEDLVFRLTYMIQVSTLFLEDEASNKYLWPKIVQRLSTYGSLHANNQSSICLQYLHEVTFNDQIGCTKVEDKIFNMENRLPLNEEGLLMYHQLIYFYKSRNNQEMVDKLLNDLETKIFKVDEKIKLYHQKLTSHIIGLSNEKEFLSNKKNIHPNSTYFVYKPLELYTDFEALKI